MASSINSKWVQLGRPCQRLPPLLNLGLLALQTVAGSWSDWTVDERFSWASARTSQKKKQSGPVDHHFISSSKNTCNAVSIQRLLLLQNRPVGLNGILAVDTLGFQLATYCMQAQMFPMMLDWLRWWRKIWVFPVETDDHAKIAIC